MSEVPRIIVDHFSSVGTARGVKGPTGELIAVLAGGRATAGDYHALVERHGLARERWFQKDRLDLVLSFVVSQLDDDTELVSLVGYAAWLKTFLHIREGEFVEHRAAEMAAILGEQLDRILADGEIDEEEELRQVHLQQVFDLSYDDYLRLTRRAFEIAMADFRALLDAAERTNAPGAPELRRKLRLLEPLHALATSQYRSLGALY